MLEYDDAPVDDAKLIADAQSGALQLREDARSVISKLAAQLTEAKAKLVETTLQLKADTEAVRRIEEGELPKALHDAGMKSLTMEDGSAIGLETTTYAEIPKKNLVDQAAAFKFIIDSNNAPLIQPTLEIAFPKGGLKEAEEAMEKLRKDNTLGPMVIRKDSIHWSTLRVFARGQLDKEHMLPEAEKKFPAKLFSCYTVERAVLTPPKKKD